MDKKEFIDKLQRALASGLKSSQVAENVRYYQEYIESEIRKGRKEKEVLAQLGDPRLLAKSIIEANKRAGTNYGSNREYDEEISGGRLKEEKSRKSAFEYNGRPLVLPAWLLIVIVTVLVVVVIGLLTSLLYIFGPVIIVGLVILLAVKIFQSRT